MTGTAATVHGTSPVRSAARVLVGGAMAFAGVMHLTAAREGFRAQVPPWVPVDEDDVVVMSGVVEACMGAAVALLPGERRKLGWTLAAFLVAVFPGNWAQYRHHRSALGLDTDRKRFVRLFFQPLMVAAALWSTEALRRPAGR